MFLVALGCSNCAHGQPILTSSPSVLSVKREAPKEAKDYLFDGLVQENDEARKEYFERKEKALFNSYNGANGGPMHPPEEAPVVVVARATRQAEEDFTPGVAYSSHPPAEQVVRQPVSASIQAARDQYRRDRFAGSSILKALKLANAGRHAIAEGGSYSG